MADAPYLLRVLGGASLEGPGGRLTGGAVQRHRLALLALLATAPEQRRPRESLATLLWPESETKNTRHLLNVAVHALRAELGNDAIRTLGQDVILDPAIVDCDAVRFERALTSGDLETATGLYRGAFLDGFFLDGSPEFERWQESERARLHRAFLQALEARAEAAERDGVLPGAVESWRQLAALEPGSGRITVRLMQALEKSGDPAGALTVAEEHAALLARDFRAEPNPDVSALAARIRSDPARLARPSPHSPGDVARLESAPRRRTAVRVATGVGAIAVLGLLWWATLDGRFAASQPRSVAVLPFENLSDDPANEIFSDGLAEELLNTLAQVPELQVAARTSAFMFKGQQVDVREVGRALGVQSLIEGSVRRQGNRVRVTAQLIRTSDGFHVWSGTYEGSLEDVFALQDSLAASIADALRTPLGFADRGARARGLTEHAGAYEHYLLGAQRWSRRAELADIREAIRHYEAAIARDPDFALAYTGLADALLVLPLFDPAVPMADALPRARAAARRALALSPARPEVHASAGRLAFYGDWDFAAARRHLDRAVALGPSSVWAYYYRRDVREVMGDAVAALEDARRAYALDPLSPAVTFVLAGLVARAEGAAAALPHYQSAVAIPAPPHEWLHQYAVSLSSLGRVAEGAAAFRRWAAALGVADTGRAAVLSEFHAAHAGEAFGAGWWEHRAAHPLDLQAAEVVADFITEAAAGPGYALVDLVFYHLYVGPDAFLRVAEAAVAAHHPWAVFLGDRVARSVMAGDSRFSALLRRVGLPAQLPTGDRTRSPR